MTMLGKRHTTKTKMKISSSKKGKTLSNGHKIKIGEGVRKNLPSTAFKKGVTPWNAGGSISRKHKMAISRANKGNVSPMKGKTFNKKVREKMSKAHIGKKQSREHVKKRTESIWGKENREKQVKAILKGLMKRPTSLEKRMIQIIENHKLPYKYVGDGSFLIGYKNPDFINTNGEKKLIEVGNIFHHQGNYIKDRGNHFAKYGWESYIFITNDLNEDEIISVLLGKESCRD